MKFHIISDIHIDHADYNEPFPECDVVLIVGDLSNGRQLIKDLSDLLSRNPKHTVAFTPGNHDYYGMQMGSMFDVLSEMSRLMLDLEAKFPGKFYYLQDEHWNFGDVSVFGSTLWSDLNAFKNPAMELQMRQRYPLSIADAQCIPGWSTMKMINANLDSVTKLTKFLHGDNDKPYPIFEKKLVMTHFSPSLRSVDPQYANSGFMNSYWHNSLDFLVKKANIWCHGHTHASCDYMIDSCRVVCNPRGYARFDVENDNFDPSLIVEL